MSIWTDLLFLHGHIATPAGLAAIAPAAAARPTPSPAHEAPSPARDVPPPSREAPPPTRTPDAPPDMPALRSLPRPNRISPNDLW